MTIDTRHEQWRLRDEIQAMKNVERYMPKSDMGGTSDEWKRIVLRLENELARQENLESGVAPDGFVRIYVSCEGAHHGITTSADQIDVYEFSSMEEAMGCRDPWTLCVATVDVPIRSVPVVEGTVVE